MKKILILGTALLTSCGDIPCIDDQNNIVTNIDGTSLFYDIVTVKNKDYGRFKFYVDRNTYRIGDTLIITLKSKAGCQRN